MHGVADEAQNIGDYVESIRAGYKGKIQKIGRMEII